MTIRMFQEMCAYVSPLIKRIQHHEGTIAAGNTSGSITLTHAVDKSNTLLLGTWRSAGSVSTGGYAALKPRWFPEPADSVTIGLRVQAAATGDIIVSICAIEFHPWVTQNSIANFGSGIGSGSLTDFNTIGGAYGNAATYIIPSGNQSSVTTQNLQHVTVRHDISISVGGTIRANHRRQGSSGSVNLQYQVFSFNDGEKNPLVLIGAASALRLTTLEMAAAATNATLTLPQACDPQFTSLLGAGLMANDFQSRLPYFSLTDANTITAVANSAGAVSSSINVSVLPWQPKYIKKITRGITNMPPGSATVDVVLTGHALADRMMAACCGFSTDNVSSACHWPTIRLIDNATLRLQRGNSATYNVDVSWEITEFV